MGLQKRVLITGGSGLLGKCLIESAPDVPLFATYHTNHTFFISPSRCTFLPLDLSDTRAVDQLFYQARPEIVIHTAGLGNVDFAEKEREVARRVNLGGTIDVLRACERHGAEIVFTSSNAVFDGETAPYGEDDPVSPINYYGRLKVECEELIMKSQVSWAIVRPILMYGWNHPKGRQNPVTWEIEKLRKGEKLHIVDDSFANPLSSASCATAIWALLSLNRHGVYHVAGSDRVSRYEFALKTAEVFDLDSNLITPVSGDFFPEIAPRPRDTTYRTDKMERDLGVKPLSLEVGLSEMKKEASSHATL